MRRRRGFTLIEMAVVVAIIAVLAAAGIGIMRAAQRNANLGSATFEFAQRLRGLRFTAMRENQDYVFVFANAVSADACRFGNDQCARWWILQAPSTWGITGFDPSNLSNGGAAYVDTGAMPNGVSLDAGLAFVAPAPFTGVTLADTDLTTTCASRACFAIRFTGNGQVLPVRVDPTNTTAKGGYAFAFTSTLANETRGAEARVVLVSFPTGLVKVFTQ